MNAFELRRVNYAHVSKCLINARRLQLTSAVETYKRFLLSGYAEWWCVRAFFAD